METLKTDEWLLRRRYFKERYTIGRLFIDNRFFCDTLEDTDRGLYADQPISYIEKTKIAGETAIPYGRYEIMPYLSPKFKRYLPLLIGVKGFSFIEIHTGNDHHDTGGCILVGSNKKIGRLVNSGYFVRQLTDRLMDNEENRILTFITIEKCAF